MENKMITALYCRTAHACDFGIEAQKKLLRNYANEYGYDNVKSYTDNGYSGVSYDRPAFARLQVDIAAGIVQVLIVKDFSRISRDMISLHKWLDSKELSEVKLISVQDGYDSKAVNPIDEIVKQLCVLLPK